MKKNIIIREQEKGRGIYIIDVDKNQAGKLRGNNHSERLGNAIRDFLNNDKVKPQLKAY